MTRYAVYALPGALGEAVEPEGAALRAAAEAWFARPDLRDRTVDPRRYGFHGTLKAPFRLAEGRTEEELHAAADAFAAGRDDVVLRSPRVARLGRFRALIAAGDESGIATLADDAVRAFEAFRAPLTDAEIARRRPERLTPRQRELFARYGYPYVLDEFRFHLTLTDPVPHEAADELDAALAAHFAAIAGVDVPLRAIALFVERAPGADFEILSVHPFAENSAPGAPA